MTRRSSIGNAKQWEARGYFPEQESGLEHRVRKSREIRTIALNWLLIMLTCFGAVASFVGIVAIVYNMVNVIFPIM